MNFDTQTMTSLAIVLMFVLYDYDKKRRKENLKREALPDPKVSPWRKLLHSRDHSSFLRMTGLSYEAFKACVEVMIENSPRTKKGRPKALNDGDQLGLYLLYISSTMTYKQLAFIFGIPPSTISDYLKHLIYYIPKVLKRHAFAKIQFPEHAKMEELAETVRASSAERGHEVQNVIGFLHGCHFATECSTDRFLHNAYYNETHKETTVNNIFFFTPDGKVSFACFNSPGSQEDSHVARPFIAQVLSTIGEFKICAEKNVSLSLSGFMDEVLVDPISSDGSLRTMLGSFCRLKERLPYNATKRQALISGIVLMHNFRTHIVGLSKIKGVFDKEYRQYMKCGTYDRVANYFSSDLSI